MKTGTRIFVKAILISLIIFGLASPSLVFAKSENAPPISTVAPPVIQVSSEGSETFTSCATVTEIQQSECNALVALYNSTDGGDWTHNQNWLQTNTPCSWDGVTCNSGTVTELSLSFFGLSGSIPADLGDLSNLTSLDLGGNYLSSSIPPELGKLSNLTYLKLSSNQLSGSIPQELGNLSNLTNLGLAFNQLSGSIPQELGNLSKLQDLFLDDNYLSGSIPQELGNITSLKELWLGDNQLSGSIPQELGNLSNLTELEVGDNQLSGSIPQELGNLSNLTYLDLTTNQLSGSIPQELGNITSLTELWFSDNKLSGSIPPELGNLTNLTYFMLGDNQLSGSIPPELGKLTNLQYLDLSYNNFSGSIPAELGMLSNLTDLDIGDNQLSGSIPPELGNLNNLTGLELDENQLSGNIPAELGKLSNLTYLDLSTNQLSGSIPSELGSLTNLTYLSLPHNQLSGSLPVSLKNIGSLESFYITGTKLCIPNDASFKAWWSKITNRDTNGACVTLSGNAGAAGVTLSYNDGNPKTVTADSGGYYSISLLQNLSTTVTPSLKGYTFSPDSINYSNITTDKTNQNYIAKRITFTIAGNASLSGVTLSYTDGSPKTATTDGSGAYSFPVSYGWSGSVTPSLKGYTFSPTKRDYTSVMANQTGQNYTLNAYTLSVSKTGTGSGTVTSSPAGISCGSTCSHAFNYNTSVVLTAAPAAGSKFSGWSGSCTGTGTCTVIMSAAKSATANFLLPPGAFAKTAPANGAAYRPISLKLSWAASTGATTYYYCIDTSNDNKCTTWINNGALTSKTLSGLVANTTYYWQVKAVNSAGTTYANGSSTAFWSFKTGLPAAFNKISPTNKITNQPSTVILKWAGSAGASAYYYCIDTTNDNKCTSWINNGTATSKTLTGLVKNTTYYWQVKAVNATGTTYANASSTAFWSFKRSSQ
jgi:Leucine-rich repeat (LRR) protein